MRVCAWVLGGIATVVLMQAARPLGRMSTVGVPRWWLALFGVVLGGVMTAMVVLSAVACRHLCP